MKLHDTARVRHPLSPVEYGLATIIAVEAQPGGMHGDRYRLRFGSGKERSYYATEITACTRNDDREALIAHMSAACRSLVAACRIAHDYDDDLSAAIGLHTVGLLDAAQTRLGVTLDPITPQASVPATEEGQS